METELRQHLKSCAATYALARGIEIVTVGRLAANDWRFFERLDDPAKTFTARKYDEVISWFSDNWPAGAEWPTSVPRPGTAVAA